MPVNVRRFCTSVLAIVSGSVAVLYGQTVPENQPPNPQPVATAAPAIVTPVRTPTSAEIMRERISKAKAFIAVRNYNAAVYELENIRRETSDQSVQAVTTVLLMNSYLEQGDYKRAQDFLTQAFNSQKTNKPGSADIYNAIAGQVIKGARMKVERYKSLGLMIADRNLPLEAINDVERMRETLELVITQAKENGKETAKANSAMALLEEATTSRSMIARDDYDAKRWKDEVADSREQLANSRSVITNAVDGTTSPNVAPPQTVAVNSTPATTYNPPASMPGTVNQPIVTKIVDSRPVNAPPVQNKPSDTLVAANERAVVPEPKKEDLPKQIVVQNPPRETPEPVKPTGPSAETPKTEGPMDVGSLIAYATKQAQPLYPPAAKSMRASGVVRVEVTVDENGQVAEVQKTSGPPLLQTAAKDAVRKWRFKPFTRDGQPVRAVGFVNFNFSL